MKWISVGDRYPEKGEYVDIWSDYHGRVVDVEFEAVYGPTEFYDNNNDRTFTDVTHWMPIPNAPDL